MRFRIITLLLFFTLGKAFSQGNSIYQVAPMPVCWHTPADRDSNLIAYWIFSPQQPQPKVVSYLVADGSQVVVSGGTLSNGFCCCNSNQDTIGITINGDTLILTQNGNSYTYIGGGGDDDWRWVDPVGDNMYQAIYREGKAGIFTQDTTYGFRVDSTYRFDTDNGTSTLEWMRGNEGLVNYKTLIFRAPGGATGAPQNDANSITIARSNATTTRTNLGNLKFAAPYTGGSGAYRVGAQISALDEQGGNDTTGVVLDFWTRKQGENFIRNTMTLEGDGRLELDRYNLFEDGIPSRMLGYVNGAKDITVHNISGSPAANFLLGVNGAGSGMGWIDPNAIGGNGIYGGDGLVSDALQAELQVNNTASAFNLQYPGAAVNAIEIVANGSDDGNIIISNQSSSGDIDIDELRTRYRSGNHLFVNSDAAKSGFVALQEPAGIDQFILSAPVLAGTIGLRLPPISGSIGQVLTLTAPGVSEWSTPSSGATNLTFSGSSSPVTLNSSTGTDVTLTAGTGISFSQTGNNLTITSTVSPVDSSIYKLLPLGDVNINANNNTLTFNTGHGAGDSQSTMRFVTNYDSDDFQGNLINFVNTAAAADSARWYWFDNGLYFNSTGDYLSQIDGEVQLGTTGAIYINSDLKASVKIDSVFTVGRGVTGAPGSIRTLENSTNGSNYYEWKAPNNLATNVSSTWPTNNNSGVLFNDGAGNTSWATYTPLIGGLFSGTTDANGVLSVTLSGTPSIGACTCTNNATTPVSFRYIFSATFTGGTGVTVRVYDADTVQMLPSGAVNFSLICR